MWYPIIISSKPRPAYSIQFSFIYRFALYNPILNLLYLVWNLSLLRILSNQDLLILNTNYWSSN